MKSTSKKRTPSIVNLTVKRRYLTEREVERLMDCARKCGRYGHRDATMILIAYRHGLRASEVCARGAPSIRRRSASCPFFILATSPMPCFAKARMKRAPVTATLRSTRAAVFRGVHREEGDPRGITFSFDFDVRESSDGPEHY